MSDIRTTFWAKPIPLRQFDWEAVTEGYDGEGPIGNDSRLRTLEADEGFVKLVNNVCKFAGVKVPSFDDAVQS